MRPPRPERSLAMAKKKLTLAECWTARRKERQVFLSCFLCIAVGFLILFGSGSRGGAPMTPLDFLPLAVYAVSLLIVHLSLVLFKSEADPLLLGSVMFLAGFGIMAQYRMDAFDLDNPARLSNYAYPAAVSVMLGVWALCRRGRHAHLLKLAYPAAVISVALLGGVLVLGQRYRGAIYGPGKMTPTEILKILVVVFLAGFLARHLKALRRKDGSGPWFPWRVYLPLAGFWGILTMLLVLERDLGLVLILSAVFLVMIYVATGHLRYPVGAGLLLVVASVLVYQFLAHGQQRLAVWQDPFQDPTGSGWQILQGLSGMYAGGLWGTGFGMGNPERIPIAKSDFIYAVIGEEMGYAGCLLVVLFYLLFAVRGFRLAGLQKQPGSMLIMVGLTAVVAGQAFLNIAGVTKFLPMTGITLPFISHGGSSLVTGFIALGLMLAISDDTVK